MVKSVELAMIAARKAQESGYCGIATVVEHRKIVDGNHLTNYQDVVVLENQACKLSYESIKQSTQGESAVEVTQAIKLFISPDVAIKPGSKITVTQSGVTEDYTCSGVPAVYPTHQEIILDLFERWA